jgi:hypothetical protein
VHYNYQLITLPELNLKTGYGGTIRIIWFLFLSRPWILKSVFVNNFSVFKARSATQECSVKHQLRIKIDLRKGFKYLTRSSGKN